MRKNSFILIAGLILLTLLLSSCGKAPDELRVIVKEEHAHPITTVIATVDAGLSREGEYCGTGISHLIEHMAFKGTPTRGPGEIEEEVKSYGGVMNASTSLDAVTYYITLPKEYTRQAIEIIMDILFNPVYDAEELEKERAVILKEIQMNNDDPSRRVGRKLWETAYTKHAYGKPVIGDEEEFKKLTREDLVKYHKRHYVPENIILTVVGDVEREEIPIPDCLSKPVLYSNPGSEFSPPEPAQEGTRETIEPFPINLSYLAMGYHTVSLSHPDLYALDVLAIILGDWDGSRLNRDVVKENELLYAVSSYNYTPKYPGLFLIYGTGDHKKINSAKMRISEIINGIARKGVSAGELDAAKMMVISDYIDSLETTSGLARAISQGEYLASDPDFFEKYVEGVKRVTGRDVRRVTRKYLRERNLSVSILHPEGVELGEGRKIKSREVKWQKMGTVPKRGLSPFSSNIRVIFKEDRRLPKIALVCAFLGGTRVETAENNGISNLMSAMLLKGTANRDESEIKPFIESRGGGISSFSGRNTFGVSMSFLSEGAEEALDVLADVIQNPVFPEGEIAKAKTKLYAALKAEDDDIFSVGFIKMRKALFPGHPYGFRVIGERESLGEISRQDLEVFHKRFCVAENMVIACVGDFDSGEMERKIRERLGDLKVGGHPRVRSGDRPEFGKSPVPISMRREQSVAVVGFRGVTVDDPARHALSLLSSVLSGQSGRLYKRIRNEFGLAYTLGAFSVPGIDAGLAAAYVATDKTNIERAKEILLEELKGGVSKKELALAKASLVGRHRISLQSKGTLAYRMALDELYGLGYNNYLEYEKDIRSVTRDDIESAAKKYMDAEKSVVVTIVGE